MPAFYDVFNGDADGICALHQLRLAEPRAAVLITGVKRDIGLVARVEAQKGDEVTVLDVSLERNLTPLKEQLARGVKCLYFDHHVGGLIPTDPNLRAFIDTSPDVCTSVLVDRFLDGSQRIWAVVGAYGDNLGHVARRVAAVLDLSEHQLESLRELGESINYNAYGDSVDDLNYDPADLYQTLARYPDPFAFISDEPVLDVLKASRADDLFRARELAPALASERCALYLLPDAAWSRRVSGSFGNLLVLENPDRAHAVLTGTQSGYRVSVRAPASRPLGAAALCREFGGGGRQGAAGIDVLPEPEVERFVAAFTKAFDS
jgi:hypothetical protein